MSSQVAALRCAAQPVSRMRKQNSREIAMSVRPSSRRFRDLSVAVKLAVAVGVALLATAVVTVVGVRRLGDVENRTVGLSRIAVVLRHGAELRDMEGDMRVNIQSVVEANQPDELQQALTDTQDTDAELDADLA